MEKELFNACGREEYTKKFSPENDKYFEANKAVYGMIVGAEGGDTVFKKDGTAEGVEVRDDVGLAVLGE